MISDVLCDAIAEIKRYQRDFPAAYDGLAGEIDQVVAAMTRLRMALDALPEAEREGTGGDARRFFRDPRESAADAVRADTYDARSRAIWAIAHDNWRELEREEEARKAERDA